MCSAFVTLQVFVFNSDRQQIFILQDDGCFHQIDEFSATFTHCLHNSFSCFFCSRMFCFFSIRSLWCIFLTCLINSHLLSQINFFLSSWHFLHNNFWGSLCFLKSNFVLNSSSQFSHLNLVLGIETLALPVSLGK